MTERPFVVVAMSGGVDSSVAAGILVEKGYRVAGMMLRLWSDAGTEDSNRCCTPDSVAQARRVAAILDIPIYILDARSLFRNQIVEDFIKGYSAGQTPNPCVLCNRLIRWGYLLEQARAIGAEYLATGHYARLEIGYSGLIQLLKAVDSDKDQSYVLSRLDQAQLAQTILPLSGLTKLQTREIARNMKLPVADRPDSQDLCFLADQNYRSFLERHAPDVVREGLIVDRSGKPIGKHAGLAFYTIGQRKGLGIPAPQPLYVISKDLENNLLTVGPAEALGRDTFFVGQLNWISGHSPGTSFGAQVKIRYKAQLVACQITLRSEDTAQVKVDCLLRDITPGQLAVFYDGEIVLGSGFIERRDGV